LISLVDELDKRYIEIAKNKTDPSINYKKEKKDGEIAVKGVGGIGNPARFYYPEYKTVARDANNLPVNVTVFDKDGMPDIAGYFHVLAQKVLGGM
jgi:hypothetical protein